VDELLAEVVEAHGGLRRWGAISSFRAVAAISGAIWVRKGRSGILEDVVLEGVTGAQRLTIREFPDVGQSAVWTPPRLWFEARDGRVVCQHRLKTDPLAPAES
jgi:hypothetical protein